MYILNFFCMWLFDDILKKPAATSGQGNPWTDPISGAGASGGQWAWTASWWGATPVIVKSESSTVFWPESEAEKIRDQNAWPSIPTVHAEEDSSSVLMPASQASAPIAPVAPAPEPIVVAPVAEAPVVPVAPTPIMPEMAQAPLPPPQMTQIPPQDTQATPVAPAAVSQDALQIPAWPSLFDHLMNDDAPAAPAPAIAPTPTSVGFQFEAAPAPAPMVAPAAPTPEAPSQSNIANTSPMSASSYATPREFIEKSLDNIDTMLETIDSRHTAKMTEAEGYRMEKMRFAELEKNAYAEAEVMDRERDHTLRMKAIFERELETDENNRTKKTQAHQDAHSDKHTTSHAHTHKRHVHEEEEEAIAAS